MIFAKYSSKGILMHSKDNGDWLSAQQAVRPDGTEVTNLPLINKKLPPLSQSPSSGEIEPDQLAPITEVNE
jgi:hypothetical protein